MLRYIIVDVTNNILLADQSGSADSYWQRLIGLMLRKSLNRGEALIINPCSSVHTHWMRFPIDVIYVNKDNVVVGIDHNLKPWRIGRFYNKVQYVIELPAGTAQASNTQPGDLVSIQESGA